MKKQCFVLFSFLVFFSFNVCAIEVSRHMSGSWYNPDQDGHGLSVEVLADGRAVIYWYVYNPDGTPTFLLAEGNTRFYGDAILATAYHVSGMRWGMFDPAEKKLEYWGDIVLSFQDCNHANLNYLAQNTDMTIPNGEGDIPLVRLASIEYLQCVENPFAGLYEGLVEQNESGEYVRAKILVSADSRFAVFAEGAFMAFGNFGEPNVNEVWSDNAILYPLSPQESPVTVPDLSVGISPGNRMLLSYYTHGPHGLGSGDTVALDQAFRRGVNFGGWGGTESIERRYTLRDLNSEDYAYTEIFATGEFSATSDQTNCNWTGLVAIPDPQFNMLDVTFDLTNCGGLDGSYTGLGFYADGHEYYYDRVLYIYARSETRPMALVLVPRS